MFRLFFLPLTVLMSGLVGCTDETTAPPPAETQAQVEDSEPAERTAHEGDQVGAIPVAEAPLRPLLQTGSPSVIP